MIAEGRITKNGQTVREPGTKADLETDDIRVDGVRVRAPREKTYLLLYKPRGVVTTRHDPERRTTVMDLVPKIAGLFPVGRLDVGTEGLLLLTNDGEFAERVSHPRYQVPRVYEAKVHGIPDAETLARLLAGIRVEGQRLAVDRVRVLEAEHNAWLELTLHEGKNHEVRRLLEAAGHPVSKLKRTALGPLTLKGLEPAQFRALTPREVRALGTLPATPARAGRKPAGNPPAPTSPSARTGSARKPAGKTPRPRGAKPGSAPPPGRTRAETRSPRPRRP